MVLVLELEERKGASHANSYEERSPGRENGKYKGPEAGEVGPLKKLKGS